MWAKLLRLYHTLRYLKAEQFYFRAYYFARKFFFKSSYKKTAISGKIGSIRNKFILYQPSSKSLMSPASFSFLNRNKDFGSIQNIDWNFSDYGILWNYNLNYFDFLNQQTSDPAYGRMLLLNYVNASNSLKHGFEPYPISLRNVNWIKFLSSNGICIREIDEFIYGSYRILLSSLERHLLGNHLLENLLSVVVSACYFDEFDRQEKCWLLLKRELDEQILADGAHFELSPMYHQILLFRLLDCVAFLDQNACLPPILNLLKQKGSIMLGWLQQMTFNNGDIPMTNDSAYDIAPRSVDLFAYALHLGLKPIIVPLNDSGYRMIRERNFELLVDVGNIGPDYIPGHAHSDTFSFVLYVKGKPLIIDKATSTYEKGHIRDNERSTSSHNTVMFNQQEQSDTWSAFRVGRRAKIVDLIIKPNNIWASHDGYQHMGIIHSRRWEWNPYSIIIRDVLDGATAAPSLASLHFHPDVHLTLNNNVVDANDGIKISFDGHEAISMEEYDFAAGFNKRSKASVIRVVFKNTLTTLISFH